MKKFFEEHTGEEVVIPVGGTDLGGNLAVPDHAEGIVLFAHGSGSSRHSVRNRFVAGVLNESRLATLLLDLFSADEESIDLANAQLRFDIAFLAQRILDAMLWLGENPSTRELSIGLFGSSTGGAAALVAAAHRPSDVAAVVSRGGRTDMAGSSLAHVACPTLFIVGGRDTQVLELNRQAYQELKCSKEIKTVPGATHLFEERGALDEVARLTAEWFARHLSSPR